MYVKLNELKVNICMQIHEIKGKLYLGMEMVREGRLTDIIKEKIEMQGKFADNEASALMRGILQAVQYMHENNIVHRDLKPGNSIRCYIFLQKISLFRTKMI